MREYEVLFIIDPTLDEEAKDAQIEKVKGVIAEGGEVLDVDVWGNRRLAYEINKKKDGFYVLITFNAGADLPKELDRRLRIADNIMRHITVCHDEK